MRDGRGKGNAMLGLGRLSVNPFVARSNTYLRPEENALEGKSGIARKARSIGRE
jgi:hypothetical protein